LLRRKAYLSEAPCSVNKIALSFQTYVENLGPKLNCFPQLRGEKTIGVRKEHKLDQMLSKRKEEFKLKKKKHWK
jgi:hypothetical protein